MIRSSIVCHQQHSTVMCHIGEYAGTRLARCWHRLVMIDAYAYGNVSHITTTSSFEIISISSFAYIQGNYMSNWRCFGEINGDLCKTTIDRSFNDFLAKDSTNQNQSTSRQQPQKNYQQHDTDLQAHKLPVNFVWTKPGSTVPSDPNHIPWH